MERKFAWNKILLLVVGVALTFALASCSLSAEIPAAAEPTPSPVPLPTAEPVITAGDALTMTLVDISAVPAGYTKVETEDPNLSLYAFTDSDGVVQYRVYGGYTEFVDGVAGQVYTGFYPSDETGAILADAKALVDPATEAFGVAAVTPIPETLRLRAKYYTMSEAGVITGTAGGTFVYGSFNGGEGAFYPADSSGKMVPGALPTSEKIAVPSYTPDSEPAADGDRMIVTYIGSQSVVVYKAVGGEWTEERVMICSTGRSKDLTPRGTFHLVRQYPYKKMGQIRGENVYSQYASRIVGSYLFHSVPIGGEKRSVQEYGKKQMFVKYYESLGTIASGGCVRLRCVDAYWIYMNCLVGTEIIITDDAGPTPPTPPPLIYEEPYMDAKHEYGWDPSDPDPENPYHAIYPPEFVLDGPVVDKSKD
jgi:lipoprotein-anchoring transpeptidase ErfK/SrfK